MLIALAGLPGAGKTALADALHQLLRIPVLSKDLARAALLPGRPAYSAADNDFVIEVLLQSAQRLIEAGEKAVVLDGRTFSKRQQLERLHQLPLPLLVVECRCSEATALARIANAQQHPAPDRSADLHRRLRAAADPCDADLIIDTDAVAPDDAARLVERHMRNAAPGLFAPSIE